MTRDRPPRLDLAPRRSSTRRASSARTARRRLVRARVAGPHARLGREELLAQARRIVAGDPLALLGLPRFDDLTVDDVLAAAAAVWGWTRDRPRGAIDPDRTLAAAAAAGAVLARTAAEGGRVAFATGRPASLLGVYASVARAARVAGAEVVECERAGPFRSRGRADCHLWWVQGVAVLTDGSDLLAASGADDAGTELEFALPRPDLVIADTPFAGAMAAVGHRVVACCDLDDLALGVAAARGFPVQPVPLNARRPPVDYAPIVDAMIGALEGGETRATPDEPPDTGRRTSLDPR